MILCDFSVPAFSFSNFSCAYTTDLEEIDLSNNKLDRFSPAVEQDIAKSPLTIEYLTVLKLSKNRFETMPDCVFTFGISFSLLVSDSPHLSVNLRTLDLHHNKLVSLNPKVLDLYQLGTFSFSFPSLLSFFIPHSLFRISGRFSQRNQCSSLCPSPSSRS